MNVHDAVAEGAGRCPTCGSRRMAWGPRAIIAAIQQWAADHDGVPPRASEWLRGTPHTPANATVLRVFGTWNAAILAAGHIPGHGGGQFYGGWTRDKMTAALFEWNYTHGRLPQMREWNYRDAAGSRPTCHQAVRAFGSWNAFLVAAGYTPVRSYRSRVSYQHQAGMAARVKDDRGRLVAA